MKLKISLQNINQKGLALRNGIQYSNFTMLNVFLQTKYAYLYSYTFQSDVFPDIYENIVLKLMAMIRYDASLKIVYAI